MPSTSSCAPYISLWTARQHGSLKKRAVWSLVSWTLFFQPGTGTMTGSSTWSASSSHRALKAGMAKKLRRGTPRLAASALVHGWQKSDTMQVARGACVRRYSSMGAWSSATAWKYPTTRSADRDVVHVVRPVRYILQRELQEADLQARLLDAGADPGRGGRRCDDAAQGAAAAQQQRCVDGRDDVTLGHERDEDEVRPLGRALFSHFW